MGDLSLPGSPIGRLRAAAGVGLKRLGLADFPGADIEEAAEVVRRIACLLDEL